MNRSKRFFSTIFTITMALTCTIPAMATEITNDTTPYVFPVQPGSTEWKSFTTKQEMIDVCQIPEEKLKSMSTEALLETVLNYPLVTTYYAFNSVEDAYNVMLSDFNGFNELLSRSDVTETLLNTYANTEILTASKAASAQPKEFFEPATIEYLIACNEIQNGDMSIDETEKFELLLEEKADERDTASIYSDGSEIYSTYKTNMAARAAGDTWTSVTGVVKTPKGSSVPEVYKRTPELTSSEKSQINSDMASLYPNATRVAAPTVTYNCHSYAWYQQSTSNPYWIGKYNAPSIYTTDGSYSKYTGTPRSGMKAWYNAGEHSGVSIGAKSESGVQVHYVKSKWGMCGIYEHAFSYSPYTASVVWYS